MSDDSFDSDTVPCSYCGASIYADAPRCPKCGNYTDGQGDFARPEERAGLRLPRIFLIAGWLLLVALVVPIIMMAYSALSALIQHLFSASK